MRGFTFILFTLICLLVLPLGNSYACSKHSSNTTPVKVVFSKKKCCDQHKQQKHGSTKKTCGHNCNGSTCKCVHLTSVFALKTHSMELRQLHHFEVSRMNAWFFKEATPKPVYLTLWMPPNITC